MRVLAVLAIMAISACATPEPIIVERVVTQDVHIPYAVECVTPSDVPSVREYADERMTPPATLMQIVEAMGIGIAQRDADIERLRGVVAGCQ